MTVLDGSKAIILSSKKILLFHRDNNPNISSPDCWQLPGGGIEKDETPLQAVERELREEVGYVPEKMVFIEKRIGSQGENVFVYISFIKDEEESCFCWGGDEGQGIGFFTINETMGLKLSSGTKTLLTKYKKILETAMETRDLRRAGRRRRRLESQETCELKKERERG